MAHSFSHRGRCVAAGVALLALAGCSSPDPHFYTLQPVQGAPHALASHIIEVRRPGLAGYLDRSDIVLQESGYRLSVNSQDRWAEPLGDMIGRVVTQDLSQRLPASSVFAENGAISADPGLRVEIDVQRFDANGGGALTLVAALAIEQGRGHLPIQARTITLSEPLPQQTAAALAAAMSSLLGQLSDQVASDIAQAGIGPSG